MADTLTYPLLDTVQFPEDIRKFPIEKLPQLCEELRHFIITQSANNPSLTCINNTQNHNIKIIKY